MERIRRPIRPRPGFSGHELDGRDSEYPGSRLGTGIPHPHVEKLFGSLGDSWKKTKRRVNGRALHGCGGKGRFKAFALGTLVEWITTYGENGKSYTYKITGNITTLDDFDITDRLDNQLGKNCCESP